MDALNIKGIKLNLNFELQLSPNGRPIRYSGISRNRQKAQQWIDGMYKSYWIYSFRFMDEVGGFISFEFDCYDRFVGVVKH